MRFRRALATLAAATASSLAFCDFGMIVRIADGADPQALAAIYGVRYADRTSDGPFAYMYARDEQHAHQVALSMQGNPNIVWVEDDAELEVIENTNGKGSSVPQLRVNLIETLFTPGEFNTANGKWLEQISWSYVNQPGREIRVAVLDTGLSPLQPSLWAKTVASMSAIPREPSPYDLRSPQIRPSRDLDPNGALGHGTMVTGIISQVAPDARFIVCRVSQASGLTTAWRLVKGLSFAVANGAEVANLSLGSIEDIPALSDVMDWAEDRGLLVVAALGNNNANIALSPSKINKVVAVTGVDASDKKASFANYHSDADFSAPSVGIASSFWNGKMATWGGTSFAAPIVSGCIAEALKHRAVATPSWLRDRLEFAGDNIDSKNPQFAGLLGVRINMLKVRSFLQN